jgi:hypothetical protein
MGLFDGGPITAIWEPSGSGGGGGSEIVARYDGPGIIEAVFGPVLEVFEPEAG